MRIARRFWLPALLAALAALAVLGVRYFNNPVLEVPGLTPGPEGRSVLVAAPATAPSEYATGGRSRVAIYLTDTSAPWLGARCLCR